MTAGSAGHLDGAPVLEVRDLATHFFTRAGVVHAVNGISYDLHAGESLAMVGESGSGKSVAALSLLGLVPPPGRIVSGGVRLQGADLITLREDQLRRVRGRRMAMVFQDPMTSLNPVLPVGRQIEEVLEAHLGISRREATPRAAALLERVGIPDARRRLGDHPHQFSGGQRQRIVIAMALACEPLVLIADEPTTALDVTIQAQIVALVRELQDELGMAVLWITHDLALVAGLVDRVAVMYAGRIVEEAPVEELFANPRHPYTRGLLASLPDPSGTASDDGRLAAIEGRPPELRGLSERCDFAPRCPYATDLCWVERPPLQAVTEGASDPDRPARRPSGAASAHRSACWLWEAL